VEQSAACLKDRIEENLRVVNEHYLRHPANLSLAKTVVYTLGKTPEETCTDILRALALTPP
jgi:hypothetical protein